MSSPAVPQEIIDSVIDELFATQGKRSLSGVALVSRSTLHRARYHLFGTVNLERSSCPLLNTEDSATFHHILKNSPVIGSYVKELVVGNPRFDRYESPYQPDECDKHTGTLKHNTLTFEEMENLAIMKMQHLFSVSSSLMSLRSLQVKCYHNSSSIAWKSLPPQVDNPLPMFFSRNSLTRLILGSGSDAKLPLSLLRSILTLSTLTTLIIEGVLVYDDTSGKGLQVTSYLNNLQAFCLVNYHYITDKKDVIDLNSLLPTIFSAASNSLSKLRWYDSTRKNRNHCISCHGLASLREISTSGDIHKRALKAMILDIIASRHRGLEVLELFEMELHGSEAVIKPNRDFWMEVDCLLKEDVFANLREIRLLFKRIRTLESMPWREHPHYGRFYSTEEVVEIFSSLFSRAVGRGVKLSYGLR